jgi:hypothetical protein
MIPQYILLGKPMEFLLNRIEQDELWRERIVVWIVQNTSLALYAALAFVGLYRLFGRLGVKRRCFALTLLSFFGTLMFPYSTVGMGAMFTVPLIVWGVVFLLKEDRSERDLLCSGLFFGFAWLTTNQTIVLAGAASLLVVWQSRKQLTNVLYFAVPIVFFVALMLIYNRLNFDSILTFPVKYWRGRTDIEDILWVSLPSPMRIVDFLVLPEKGVFFYSPFLILAIPGFKKLLNQHPADVVVFLILCFILYLSFFLSIFLAESEGPFGGRLFGYRYIVPALPFLCIGAAVWISDRDLSLPEILLIGISICICTAGGIFNFRTHLYDYTVPFLLSFPASNFITDFLRTKFGIENIILRFFTTILFFGGLGVILLKYRIHSSEYAPGMDSRRCIDS